MVLVRDEPVAIDVAQSDGQPEQEPALFRGAASVPNQKFGGL
jgi:hypothetical protein